MKNLLSVASLIALTAPAAADVTFDQSILFIETFGADDDITIRVGPMAGQVHVSGAGPGSGAYQGVRSIFARTRGGGDEIDVIGASAFLPRLFLDLGTGDNDVDIDFRYVDTGLLPINAAGIQIRTRGGDDDVSIELETANLPGFAFVDADLGDGDNDIDVDFSPDDSAPSLELNAVIRGGAGTDEVDLDVGDDTPLATVSLRGDLGAGEDDVDVDVDARSDGATALDFELDLGADDDSVDCSADGSDCALSGRIDAGSGDDTLEVLGRSRFVGSGVLLRGERGDDSIKLNCASSNESASRIEAGDGDDSVEVLVQNGSTSTPTTSDGGPGFDVFTGIGVATNFESVQ